MVKFLYSLILLSFIVGSSEAARAQNPQLAESDLFFSSAMPHLVAKVRLEQENAEPISYQFDYYTKTGWARIRLSDGTEYVRKPPAAWQKSSDWGETGTAISPDKEGELETFASVIRATFAKPENHDATQGASVWKFIREENVGDRRFYTYELSREKPKPEALYPRFIFLKTGEDTDGSLLLMQTELNLRSEDGALIHCTAEFDYLFPVPEGTSITVKGKQYDSKGWELSEKAYRELKLKLPSPTMD